MISGKIRSLLNIENNSNENNIIVSDLRQTYYEILDDIGFYVKYKDKVKAQSNVESLNKSIASYTTFYDRVLAKTEELSKECKNGDTELLENIKYGKDYIEFTNRLRENAKKYFEDNPKIMAEVEKKVRAKFDEAFEKSLNDEGSEEVEDQDESLDDEE